MTAPVVNAPCGTVRGVERPGSLAFLGIPFAEAPIGALRYQAPVRRAPFEGLFDATRYGATPQKRAPFPFPAIPEPIVPGDDILNLNVFTPSPDAAAKMPVHVYIHGGGYIAGSHVGAWFDGATYNRDGIVVVAIAYRLGFDGFGWIADAPRNRGLLDMVCALEWVRDNISAFGGDPGNVTISGQSAGGGAVLSLLSMPLAQGLFHRVIAHSPVIGTPTAAEHEALGRAFAARAGVDPTVAGWAALTADQVLDLQFAPPTEMAIHPMANNLLSEPTALCEVTMQLGPAIDETSLPVPPHQAWADGFNREVPVLVGATADEFIMPQLAPPTEQVLTWLDAAAFSPELDAFARGLIAAGEPDVIGRLATTVMFRRNVLRIAAARARGGASTWMFDFQHRSSVTGMSGHCLELPFSWNCLGDSHVTTVAGRNQPRELAEEMHGDWVAFMRSGDPGWAAGTGKVFGGTVGQAAFADVASLA